MNTAAIDIETYRNQLVGIYRLVAQHTIEEKIVALHRHKRALADSLLEGTDAGGKLSTEELLQLMSESR